MSKDYKVTEVFKDSYRIEDNPSSSSYFLLGSKRGLLIDTGAGCGNIKACVDKIANGKPYDVVNTHGHFDHVGGDIYFKDIYIGEEDQFLIDDLFLKDKSPIIDFYRAMGKSYEEGFYTKDAFELFDSSKVTWNYHYLEDGQIFDLGDGREIECIFTPGHTKGSFCFLDKVTRIMYTGDNLLRHCSLANGNGVDSIKEYYATLEKMYSRRSECYALVGAHGHRTEGFRPLGIEYCLFMMQLIKQIDLSKAKRGPSEMGLDSYEYYLDGKHYEDFEGVCLTFTPEQYDI